MRVEKGTSLCTVLIALLFLVVSAPPARASTFDIILDYTGIGSFTASEQTALQQAVSYWEGVIPSYKNGISISSLNIYVGNNTVDGVGGSLATSGIMTKETQNGFTLSTSGLISFDSADMSDLGSKGLFYPVVLHEMAHVIGFGSLWTENGVYVNNTGQYTGASALAAYRKEFNSNANYVPVELGGGTGTANAHWNEIDGGTGLTGIVDSKGRDMQYELMTGWLNGPVFISDTTLTSFEDIGYTVSHVPVPGTVILLGSGILALLGVKRRKGALLRG